MEFLKRWRRSWHNKANASRKELYLIYGWASLKVTAQNRCAYVNIFKIVPIGGGDAIPNGVLRGRSLRIFVHQYVLWKSAPDDWDNTVGQNLIYDWDQIIPSPTRLPTHRLEMGLMQKGSSLPRSPFFDEYFCFLPLNGGDSNKVAIKIATFLSSRLKETGNFRGEALPASKTYWLISILSAWRQLGS